MANKRIFETKGEAVDYILDSLYREAERIGYDIMIETYDEWDCPLSYEEIKGAEEIYFRTGEVYGNILSPLMLIPERVISQGGKFIIDRSWYYNCDDKLEVAE